jgi:two-component system, cell cycle sensor histidine kinase and response regulator CckA
MLHMEPVTENELGSEKRTALVVDDDGRVRRMLTMGLEALGFVVDVASSGEDALALLDDGNYDAVICDLMMPDMCGDELFRVCERRHPGAARRFIFLSGSPRGTAQWDAACASGQPCLSKPCRLADLQAAIADLAS